MHSPTIPALTLLLASLAPTRGAAQDVDAMARWTAYEVVHYRAVGQYSGVTRVLLGKQGLYRVAPVQDRVVIDFDWNQQEMKVVSTPAIQNFPSTVGALQPVQGCPAARVDGTYEMATVTAVTDMGGTMLTVASTRNYPAGSIPLGGEMDPCGTTWEAVAASTVAETNTLQVLPAMMLAMPGAGAYAVTPDGKSLYVKAGDTGVDATGLNDWSWTFTPTPVR